jgi:hypothetical protein
MLVAMMKGEKIDLLSPFCFNTLIYLDKSSLFVSHSAFTGIESFILFIWCEQSRSLLLSFVMKGHFSLFTYWIPNEMIEKLSFLRAPLFGFKFLSNLGFWSLISVVVRIHFCEDLARWEFLHNIPDLIKYFKEKRSQISYSFTHLSSSLFNLTQMWGRIIILRRTNEGVDFSRLWIKKSQFKWLSFIKRLHHVHILIIPHYPLQLLSEMLCLCHV